MSSRHIQQNREEGPVRLCDLQRHLIVGLVVTTMCLPLGPSPDTVTCDGGRLNVVRFDAVVELTAPVVMSHATVFIRYWVSSEAYVASVVWAEPHVGSLNISAYPVSMTIESTKGHFHIASQTHEFTNSQHVKPTPPRGPFYHKLNAYGVADMRFAEREALATRIYDSDLDVPLRSSHDSWTIIRIPTSSETSATAQSRDVATLRVRGSGHHIDSLQLYDANDRMLKSVDYTWATLHGHTHLTQQRVVLPEVPFCIGFEGEGLVAHNGRSRYVVKTMNAPHHVGERHCTVRYSPFVVNARPLSIPYEVTVVAGDTGSELRSARLFDLVCLEMSLQEMRDEAKRFASFTGEEICCREMLAKYWMEPPSSIAEEDRKLLGHLVKHFEKEPVLGRSPGEYLKRAHMLFSLAIMLDDEPGAIRYFDEYLSALSCYGLDPTLLLGGAELIDRAIRWNHLGAADGMLARWVHSANSVRSLDLITRFVDAVPRTGHLWQTIKLIDLVLPSVDGVQDRCRLAVHRALALGRLCRYEIDGGRTTGEEAQLSWALSQAKPRGLLESLDESIRQAQRFLAQHPDDPVKTDMNMWLRRCIKDRDMIAISSKDR